MSWMQKKGIFEDLYVYQPWSVPLLHTSLPDKILKELIQLTDIIEKDEDRESWNDELAGEIENEWKIDSILLTNIKFTEYVIQYSWEYYEKLVSNYAIRDYNIPPGLVIFKSILENIELTSAWFNDQKDNEYSPMHKHTGILSGVLYLMIPEYLPSRKNKDTDGAITFIGNETAQEGMISNSTLKISPKVGDIFMFPSSLKHEVYPFRTKDGKGVRRSLSFNLNTDKFIPQAKWFLESNITSENVPPEE